MSKQMTRTKKKVVKGKAKRRLVRGRDFDAWGVIDVPTGKVRHISTTRPRAAWIDRPKKESKQAARIRLYEQLHVDYCGIKECCRLAMIKFVEVKP